MITSVKNTRIKLVRALQARVKTRREEGAFIVEGVRLAEEAVIAGWQPRLCLYTADVHPRGMHLVEELRAAGTDVEEVAEHVMQAASDTQTPQGILLVVSHARLPLPEAASFVLVLDNVQEHVDLALKKRADLNQAQLLAQKGEIEVVKTKNGLLPQMDLFINLGKTGYADSFGGSVENLVEDGYDALVGLSFTYPVKKRSAQAQHRRATLVMAQTRQAILNLSQLVELDVRSAYIQVGRAKDQIDASRATRLLQEEKLRIETEKFKVGRSTNFMVAQAQRDLVGSRISEIQAVADYLISLTRLHQMEGALLDRRGIQLME
ncbi:MAG: TolC family protein [Anaerolineales bacterium]